MVTTSKTCQIPSIGNVARMVLAPRRDRTPHGRWHTGTRGDAQAAFAGRRSHQDRGHRATERDLPCASGLADTMRARAGAPHVDASAWEVSERDGLSFLHTP